MSKNDGRCGTFEEDLQRCISRGRRSAKDMFIRAVRRSGRWFPERGCILEHQIFRFAEMILRDRCSTSYDLASLFRGRRNILDRWGGLEKKQNALVQGRQLCTQLSIFDRNLTKLSRFWCCQLRKLRKSRRHVSFLMLSSSKVEEVSQSCFAFDVVKFENWGSLVVLFLMLSSSKIEEVLQNSCAFKLTVRQTDRQAGRQAGKAGKVDR